jgi:aryl-alcohol dehydrogenase-like predicted oxidoreductase
MDYKVFPGTEQEVSEICLGTMTFGAKCDFNQSERIVNAALELGVNFLDTAAMYADGTTESFLGKILKGKRDRVFLGTKVHRGLDRKSITESIEDSLQRLQTDHVDLYMIHWPAEGMDLTEMMSALNDVVKAGKTRYVGCCNFPAFLMGSANRIALENGWPPLICNQVAYNLFERGIEVEILPQAVTENYAITTYRPLAVGLLAGKYRLGQPFPNNKRGTHDSRVITWFTQHGRSIENFVRFAEERGVHPAQLAIAWVAHSPGVTTPIVGVSSESQLNTSARPNVIRLSEDDHRQITDMFNTEVKEEGLQLFPGLTYNFPRLRRNLNLAKK